MMTKMKMSRTPRVETTRLHSRHLSKSKWHKKSSLIQMKTLRLMKSLPPIRHLVTLKKKVKLMNYRLRRKRSKTISLLLKKRRMRRIRIQSISFQTTKEIRFFWKTLNSFRPAKRSKILALCEAWSHKSWKNDCSQSIMGIWLAWNAYLPRILQRNLLADSLPRKSLTPSKNCLLRMTVD